MSDVIMNVILFALIFVPMMFLVIRRGSEGIAQFKSMMKMNQVELGDATDLTNQVLALDKSKSNIYYWVKGNPDFEKIDLNTLSEINVIKSLSQGFSNEVNVTSLQKVEIQLLKKNKEQITWPVYQINQNQQIGSDLLDAEDFVQKVKPYITK